MNNNKLEKMDIILRYKKSIDVDSLITFILFWVLFISFGVIFEINGWQTKLILIPILFVTLIEYFLKDFIFHRSIGKRIYRLKIETNIEFKKKLLKALVMRKFYEATYHPLFNKDFAAIVNMIEAMTETKIADNIKTLSKQ
jgi:hypothetical protein